MIILQILMIIFNISNNNNEDYDQNDDHNHDPDKMININNIINIFTKWKNKIILFIIVSNAFVIFFLHAFK